MPTIDEAEADERAKAPPSAEEEGDAHNPPSPERSLTGVVPMPSRRRGEGYDARKAAADAAWTEIGEDLPEQSEQAPASPSVAASERSLTGVVPMPSRRRGEGYSTAAALTGWEEPPDQSEQASASGPRTGEGAAAEATEPQKPTSSRTFRAKSHTRPTVRFAVQDHRTHTPRALTRQEAIAEGHQTQLEPSRNDHPREQHGA